MVLGHQGSVALTVGSVVRGTIDPKLRHFHWLLNRLTTIMTNENDAI